MEEQARVEHELKNVECMQMLKDLQSGSITQADMNTFMAAMGSTPNSVNITVPSPRTHFLTDTAQISNQYRWNQTQVDSSQYNPDYQLQQKQKSSYIRQNDKRNNLYTPNQRKIEIPGGYDRSTSSNSYVNGSKVINGDRVYLICGNSGHLAVRGGLNCPPSARKLDLIESAIIRSLLFPNDRNVGANMTLIRSRYYNQNSLNTPSGSQQIPHFIPDELDSYMFQYNEQMSGNPQILGTSKENNLNDDLEKANERERYDRQSRRQKKGKEREDLDAIPDITQRNLNSDPKTSIPFAGPSKSNSETKLRTIFGREGKGPLDYKKMLENTMIAMSMIDFYQAGPDFSKTSRKLSTRINEKRVKRKNVAKLVWNVEPEEEELLVEASSSLVDVDCDRKIIPKYHGEKPKIECLTTNTFKIPTVDLKTTPIIRTTTRKDRAFRIPGEVLATRNGKTGKFFLDESMVCADQGSDMVVISPQLVRVLQLQKNSLNEINNQAITMGTADGIQRQIYAFLRPERGPTLDLFLLLGLPRLHSVKAVINICRLQIKIGYKNLGELCTVLQGPTFEFAKKHRFLLQPTQIQFKGALRTEEFELKEKTLENKMKDNVTCRDSQAASRALGNYSSSKESVRKFHDEKLNKQPDATSFSSDTEDSITVDGSDCEKDHANQELKSASTDPDFYDECKYSSDEDSEDISETHMGKGRVTRMK
ncbi:hypothetical protein EV44_g3734 [Erysiphe necator]|uniref:Uncharacterized protein n=1 Tax=Uncinula necator TaxID=52586 RepID=A0A0B1P631_UNCNE|nr:hypothetical protein EV44_g3734 [Erysiphe necator]